MLHYNNPTVTRSFIHISGRPALLNKYYGVWPAHWRPYAPPQRLLSLNEHRPKHGSAPHNYNYQRRIPEAKNHYQQYQGNDMPRLSVELDVSIKPYFNRARNDAYDKRGSQGSPETSTQFGRYVYDCEYLRFCLFFLNHTYK